MLLSDAPPHPSTPLPVLRIVGGMTVQNDPAIRPLTEQENSWIQENWEVSTKLLMTMDSDALTRGYLLTRANWEQAPADQRPPAEHAVVGLGALAGQYICNHTDFEWGVRGTGPEAAWVIHNPEGQTISPMQQVAAIWTGASTQTLGEFVDGVLEGYSGER